MASPATTTKGHQPTRRQLSDRAVMLLFLLPTMIILIVMNIYPLFYSLYLSFTKYSVISSTPPQWVGFANYTSILSDARIWHNFAVTGQYTVLSVGLQVIVGFGLALALKDKFRGSGIITTLILVPMMLSPVVVGLFWRLMFNPSYGIVNLLLGFRDASTAPEWLGSSTLAMWSIVIVDVWMWSPFVMLLCLAGLSAIPDYLYEAAAIDRAKPWFIFRRITLPQVMPLLLIAVLFRTIEALKQFDLVMGLTGGGPGNSTETVAVALYRRAFQGQFDTGYSSALAYIVLIVVIAISSLYIRQLNKVREA